MAVVVPSLAAFVAGSFLPGPVSAEVSGSSWRRESPPDRARICDVDSAHVAGADVGVDDPSEGDEWSFLAEALFCSSTSSAVRSDKAADIQGRGSDQKCSGIPDERTAVLPFASTPAVALPIGIYKLPSTGEKPDRTSRAGLHVRFDLGKPTLYQDFPPYSKVYGRHPRSFHFSHDRGRAEDRLSRKQPKEAWRFVDPSEPGDDVPSDDEDEDDQRKAGRKSSEQAARINRLLVALDPDALSWHFWCVSFVCCWIFRAIGSQLCDDLLNAAASSAALSASSLAASSEALFSIVTAMGVVARGH